MKKFDPFDPLYGLMYDLLPLGPYQGINREAYAKMNNTIEEKPEEIIQGKIIHLDSEKGFGFISAPSIRFTRIFFHWTALKADTLHFTKLKRGMKVEFIARDVPDQVVEGIKVHKGWRAIKIKVIEDDIHDQEDN